MNPRKESPSLQTNLLAVTLASGIIWAVTIPLWHFPDEQAHFAQVQNYAEIGHSPKGKDLSLEIYESERILGTLRDELGRNRFTYNPSFRIDYTRSRIGEQENYLKSLPQETRTTYVKTESPRYPPLFYIVSALGYKLAYPFDLFTRVLTVRLMSVTLFLGIVFFTYKFSQELFPKTVHLQITTTALVAFHPMLTFVSSGVNNDTLLTLLSTILLFLTMKMIRSGQMLKNAVLIIITVSLGVLTKQLIYLLFPTLTLAVGISMLSTKLKRGELIKLCSLVVLIGSASIFFLSLQEGFWLPFWPEVSLESPGYHFSSSALLKERLLQLYRETLPWYWGVFKWLGIVLPLNVIRAIKVAMVVSALGWLKYLINKIKSKKMTTLDYQFALLLFANLSYVSALLLWDTFLTRSMGFGHGLQGRYFFPLIASHMAFFAFGLWQLIAHKKYQRIFILGVVTLAIVLNLAALHRVLGGYYDFIPISTFLNQVSQYKSSIAKWPYVGLYLTVYLASISTLFYQIMKKKV